MMPSLQTIISIFEWINIGMKAGQVVVQGAIEAIKLYEASASAQVALGTAAATATATATATVTAKATPTIAVAMATTPAVAG